MLLITQGSTNNKNPDTDIVVQEEDQKNKTAKH